MVFRTHNCAELRIENVGLEVCLIGWAQRIRDHGGKKFIDLRDRFGITQIVFDPDETCNFSGVEEFRREFLIQIKGVVRPRPEGTKNEKHVTGEIEVLVSSFKIENSSEVLPFELDLEHFNEVNEELRLEYRYLDLRRAEMQGVMIRRHRLLKSLRDFFDSKNFIEMDTPNLTRSTPEGARDFLVPYRKKKGEFFALPQSPQLFKQLLMVAGYERYYQVATCFRDEDLRKDRQYEHKQLDLEMSFTTRDELFALIEEGLSSAFSKTYGIEIKKPFKVLTYKEAIEKYGSDKPDLRISGLELVNISDISKTCNFSVFSSVVSRGGIVKGFLVPNGALKYSRNDIDKLISLSQEMGAKGLAWMKVIDSNGGIESSITKFFTEDELLEISKRFGAGKGDLLLFVADEKDRCNSVLDGLRRHIAKELELLDESLDLMYWVIDFPLFQWDVENGKLDFEHNPFSMPLEEDVDYILGLDKSMVLKEKDRLLSLVSDCYDLVYNGVEICSGARRIHRPRLQQKMFELVDFSDEKIEESFGWFIKAYNYGAPPHRGVGIGIDRVIMLAERKASIRDVIPFPRNKHGYDPLTRSPSSVDLRQLSDLGLSLLKKKEN